MGTVVVNIAARIVGSVVVVAAVALVTVVGGPGPLPRSVAAENNPHLEITPTVAAPNDSIRVRLDSWPEGTVIATVCGNGARRGTQDCALRGAQGEAVAAEGPTVFGLVVPSPPGPCPCVVLVSTPTNDVVRTVPIEVTGVPVDQTIPAASSAPLQSLAVKAKLDNSDRRGSNKYVAALAGPVHRTLRLALRNNGTSELTGLRVNVSVGRDRGSGQPVAIRELPRLAPGTTHVVTIPVEIDGPAIGTYHVFGRVFGDSEGVQFSTTTSNDPWLLELLVPISLLVVARVLRRRERRARERDTASSEGLVESSPDVGAAVGERSPTPAYAPIARSDAGSAQVNGHQLVVQNPPVVVPS